MLRRLVLLSQYSFLYLCLERGFSIEKKGRYYWSINYNPGRTECFRLLERHPAG